MLCTTLLSYGTCNVVHDVGPSHKQELVDESVAQVPPRDELAMALFDPNFANAEALGTQLAQEWSNNHKRKARESGHMLKASAPVPWTAFAHG
jgi:hypothetical protein